MAKMKIFELKNDINGHVKKEIESKDILDYLEKSFGVKKTHSSNLEDNEVQIVKNHFIKGAQIPIQKPVEQVQTQSASKPVPAQTQQHNHSQHTSQTQPAQRMAQTGQSANAQQGQKPAQGQQNVVRQSEQNTQRPIGETGHQSSASAGQRPTGGQNGMRQGQQGYQGQTTTGQGYQGSNNTGNSQNQSTHPQGQRPSNYSNQGSRPAGQTQQYGQNQQGSQNSQAGAQRTQGYNQGRPQGEGYQGNRPPREGGYQGQQGGYRPQGDRPQGEGYQGNRPPREGGYQGQQGGYRPQGDRPQGEGYQRRPQGEGYQGNRPQGEGYQGNRPPREGGYQGQQGGYRPQGDRPQGEGYQRRPQGEGYQGNRPQGEGYQGNRPPREGGYQGQQGGYRPQGDRPQGEGYQRRPQGEGYQGNRPQGEGYQGNRPQGGGYQGQQGGYRPQGDRPQGGGYQGNRPQGGGYQGNRPQGEGYQGQQGGYRPQGDRPQGGARPYSGNGQQNRGGYGQNTGGYSRPNNGTRPGGGYGGPRGFEDGNKDEDDKPSYGNKAQGRKPAGAGRGPSDRKNFDQKILDQKVAEKNDNSNKRNRDRINKEKNYKDRLLDGRDDETGDIKSKTLITKKGQFIQPKPIQVIEEEIKVIAVPEILTIKELADKMKKPSAALIKKLFLAGKIVTLNQEITFEEAQEIALEYEIIAEKEVKVNEVEELLKEEDEDPSTMEKRPPVVCVMGHVDHGKTSLLDAIRETNVTSREAGGITQHIGAYVVEINGEKITFLDTPGHEAFTAMRMRGAKSTDIAILVVAADDGVMPQTIEAINHAKAAGVQIIVAINKIDKPSANIERVKQELTEYELVAEDWGGDTIFVPVSAHTKEGIDHLLEMILLTAEMVELKANPNRNARGIVIEAELDKGRGPVATILVQKGTLRVGDNVAVGSAYGKVRAMNDDKGRRVKEATPSTPVEILGLNEVPDAGETLLVTANEKEARAIADAYLSQGKERLLADTKAKLSLDGLFSQIQAGNIKDLNLIIKADVQGSTEAMKQSLLKLSNSEVAVRVIHSGVGAINESDVILASTSNAIIIGFNVKPDNAAKETADREKVDVKLYRVIYNAINDIEAAMKGMLDPVFEERIIGHAEIRMTFKASGVGTIAGSYVLDGKVIRGSKTRIYRDNTLIYDGVLASLKRFQDDVKEVASNYECGLVFEKFNDVKEGDKAEFFIMAEVPR